MHFLRSLLLLIVIHLTCNFTRANDTLYVNNSFKKGDLLEYLEYFSDTSNQITLNQLLDKPNTYKFITNSKDINFGFSKSSHWLKTCLKNTGTKPLRYKMQVRNPDIAYLNFYVLKNDSLIKEVNTGELLNYNTRDVLNRFFVCSIAINPGETFTIYIRVENDKRHLYVPVFIEEENVFQVKDLQSNMINWLTYGVILFICFFNIYLYYANKRRSTNVYIAAYIFSGLLFLFYYDGYHFLLSFPDFNRSFKFFTIFSFSFFMLFFVKKYTKGSKQIKYYSKLIDIILVLYIIVPIGLFLPYPIDFVSEQIAKQLTGISIICVVLISILTYDKKQLPSKITLLAHSMLLISFIVIQLKEKRIISYSIFSESSIKLGLAIQNILLTIAVLEQFRINQDNFHRTIENNLKLIDQQNKELEFINIELEKLSIVASKSNNAVAICNNDGLIEWCNHSFEQYYKVNQIEILESRKHFYQQVCAGYITSEQFEHCVISKQPTSFESHLNDSGDEKIWVQTSLTPYIRSNMVTKVIVIDSDITELKQYERKLENEKKKAMESDRLKTVFLRNMSHEVRTPLNGIIGFSELLQCLNNSEEVKNSGYTQQITKNCDQLLHIIDDILDISLIESNQLKMNIEVCRLTAIIDEAELLFDKYSNKFNKPQLQLEIFNTIDKEKDFLLTDTDRIKQILENLLENAIKFTQEGIVRITVIENESEYIIAVEDTGIGVNPSKKDIIFQRFRQEDEKLERRYGGTGLGLSICKGILDVLGGRIWLDTDYTNGARFVFSIPRGNLSESKQVINQTTDHNR